MTENVATTGAVVYRINGEDVEFLGIYQTKEKADRDIKLLAKRGQGPWHVKVVLFLGWGQAAPGVFSQNGPAPLRIVPKDGA